MSFPFHKFVAVKVLLGIPHPRHLLAAVSGLLAWRVLMNFGSIVLNMERCLAGSNCPSKLIPHVFSLYRITLKYLYLHTREAQMSFLRPSPLVCSVSEVSDITAVRDAV
jgi:hypothetical protein